MEGAEIEQYYGGEQGGEQLCHVPRTPYFIGIFEPSPSSNLVVACKKNLIFQGFFFFLGRKRG